MAYIIGLSIPPVKKIKRSWATGIISTASTRRLSVLAIFSNANKSWIIIKLTIISKQESSAIFQIGSSYRIKSPTKQINAGIIITRTRNIMGIYICHIDRSLYSSKDCNMFVFGCSMILVLFDYLGKAFIIKILYRVSVFFTTIPLIQFGYQFYQILYIQIVTSFWSEINNMAYLLPNNKLAWLGGCN